MKALEDSASLVVGGMMSDLSMWLDEESQIQTAQWATKTAMVWEFLSRSNAVFYTADQRATMRTHQTIPTRTTVWLARHGGHETFSTFVNAAYGHVNACRIHGHATTVAMGSFVCQVFTYRLEGECTGERLILDGQARRWQDCLTQIWPFKRPVSWPPARSIPAGEFEEFHNRFGFPPSP